MTKKIIAMLVGAALMGSLCAATVVPPNSVDPAVVANTQVMSVSNGVSGPSHVSMLVVKQSNAAPLVKINLSARGRLTVYDQNDKIAFTQRLLPGLTTIDTANFPLGKNYLVVNTSQNGSSFTMRQAIVVTSGSMSGS